MGVEGSNKKSAPERFDLTGAVALVTGAGRGIGAGLALALAEAGADLALVARSKEQLERTAGRITEIGRQALVIPADLTEIAEIHRIVEQVIARFKRIDVLVNAAGTQARKPALEVTEEDWDRVNSINLKAVYFCSQAVARQMIQQGRGKIINIASLTSSIGIPNVTIYTATKGGVLALTRGMAAEWAQYGIRVNAIGPGYFRTEMTTRLYDDPEKHQWVLSRTPMGQWGKIDDLAGAALFLASEASDFVTGQLINVDGGWLAS